MEDFMRFTLFLASCCLSFFFSAFAAHAVEDQAQSTDTQVQDPNDNENPFLLQGVTVTADKLGPQDIQKVPESITAITETRLQDARIEHMEDIAKLVPNLHFVEFGASFEQKYFIRGIGSTHNDPAISFNIDGVTQARMESSDIPLMDIERVEILRGPQGTLYGRNSLGGVVNIITRKPDNEARGKFSIDYGKFGAQEYQGTVSGPLVEDKLFAGFSFAYGDSPGFTRNKFHNNSTVDSRIRRSGKGTLRWVPEDGTEFNLVLNASRDTYGVYALQPIKQVRAQPHKTAFDHNGKDSKEIYGATLTADFEVGEKGKITSISSIQSLKLRSDSDADFSIMDFQVMKHRSDNLQASQELRFAHGKEVDWLRWVAGIYGWYADQDDRSRFINGQDMALWGMTPGETNEKDFHAQKIGSAVFGQMTMTFFDKLDLTLGLRGEIERQKADVKDGNYFSGQYDETFNLSPSQNFSEVLPKISLAYRVTDDIMPYITVTRGYRSGGFNSMFDSTNTNSIKFDPEYSWNYEAGIKTSFLDKKIQANLSAFYIELEDMQVNVGVPGHNLLMVDNAGKATSKGIELEMLVRPLPGLELSGTYGYTHMEFKNFSDPVRNKDFSGKYSPYVPLYNYSLAAQYRFPITDYFDAFGRVELLGFGEQYWDNGNTESQKAYNLLNAQIGIESEHWDIYLYAKNITDKEYIKTGYETGNGAIYGQSGDPFTIGLNTVFKF